MSDSLLAPTNAPARRLIPPEEQLQRKLGRRQLMAAIWRRVFLAANVFALLALILVFGTIINRLFGLAVVTYQVAPDKISARPLNTLTTAELEIVLSKALQDGVITRDRLRAIVGVTLLGEVSPEHLSGKPLSQVLQDGQYPSELAQNRFGELTQDNLVAMLRNEKNLSADQLKDGIKRFVIGDLKVQESTLTSTSIDKLSSLQMRNALRKLTLDQTRYLALKTVFAEIPRDDVVGISLPKLVPTIKIAPEYADKSLNELPDSQYIKILVDNLSQAQITRLIERDIIAPFYPLTFTLLDSIFNRAGIEAQAAEKFPGAPIEWRSWINWEFVTDVLTANYATTGLRMALLGSIYVVVLTVLIALPLGVGAAIYLEEYAPHNRLTTFIETNIRNLAGVPSIIYGILGLAVFARFLSDITSGRFLGVTDSTGRSILSASLTMALLILPVVIINSQEAIRAVPASLREASFGIGATRWQTVWRVVMPSAIPGVMTGLILSVSRAVGETAPLLVVGGLTFVTQDPSSIFSKFTVIPIQIFSWSREGEQGFQSVAAAGIIILLIFLLSLNLIAIVIRQRFSKKLRG